MPEWVKVAPIILIPALCARAADLLEAGDHLLAGNFLLGLRPAVAQVVGAEHDDDMRGAGLCQHVAVEPANSTDAAEYGDPAEFELAVEAGASVVVQAAKESRELTVIAGGTPVTVGTARRTLDQLAGVQIDDRPARTADLAVGIVGTARRVAELARPTCRSCSCSAGRSPPRRRSGRPGRRCRSASGWSPSERCRAWRLRCAGSLESQ